MPDGWVLFLDDDDGKTIWSSDDPVIREMSIVRFCRVEFHGLWLIAGPVTTRHTGCSNEAVLNTLVLAPGDPVQVNIIISLPGGLFPMTFGP